MKEPTQQLFNTMAREMFEAHREEAKKYINYMPEWNDIGDEVKNGWLSAAKAAYDVIISYENHNSRESSSGVVSKAERLRQIEDSMKDTKPFYAR